jgi:GrpB-like predicted nucleotidyltransferase (UPF0157 family)
MPVEIVSYRDSWPREFAAIAADVRSILGAVAVRIDHIGSTSIQGLAAKDRIDIEVGVATVAMLDEAVTLLAEAGYAARPISSDHVPPGGSTDPADWQKRFLNERPGDRPANVHVRVAGAANHRYALLFRDYLRTHESTASAYETLKRRLGAMAPDTATYADAKDPGCDLIILAAEDWVLVTGWSPGPTDG